MQTGRVRRGWLGISAQNRPIPRHLARHHGLEQHSGVEVMSVESGGPSARAQVRVNDILVALDGKPVASVDDVHRTLTQWEIGAPLRVALLRRVERLEVDITPGEAPA
jgi:S1-C subfamily serine protease